MSMPTSRIASIASGCTRVARVPALWISRRSPAIARRKPSAIWERAELCAQRKRTRFTPASMTRGAGGHPAPRGRSGENCGAECVDQRAGRRAAAEDGGACVEDENEDDEDQQDDADDHAGAESALRRRSARIHVDLAHGYLLYY